MARARKKSQPRTPSAHLRFWHGVVQRRRLLGMWLMLLGICAVLAAGIGALRDPHTLAVRTVVVEGQLRHLNRARLIETVSPHVRGGFFSLELGAADQALKSLPWVYQVSLRRRWPDTLVVRVYEQEPIAQWGESALLNRHGERFTPPKDELPQGLAQLSGPDGDEHEVIERFLSYSSRLSAVGLELRALEKDKRMAWHLRLSNGVTLDLGRGEHGDRLGRFLAAYPGALAPLFERVRGIDLRYTNGFAVAWKDKAVHAVQGE